MAKPSERLVRYTDLAPAMHMLINKKITLLSPRLWEDQNDAHYMKEYENKTGVRSVLAVCFSENYETFHHWKVYANGGGGIRIHFDKQKLLKSFSDNDDVDHGFVKYVEIKNIRNEVRISKLPFIKRWPYRDECEYRVIYKSSSERTFMDFDLDLDSISRIAINPWLPKGLFNTIKGMIKNIDGCSHIETIQSTVKKNDTWCKAATNCTLD